MRSGGSNRSLDDLPGARAAAFDDRIAGCLERPISDITHPLTVLQDCGLVRRETDAFRGNRSVYRVGEPLIAFDHAVSRPKLALLDRGMAEHVWEHDFDPLSNVIDVHIARLRRKIDDDFPKKLLHTVRGRGYILGKQKE